MLNIVYILVWVWIMLISFKECWILFLKAVNLVAAKHHPLGSGSELYKDRPGIEKQS